MNKKNYLFGLLVLSPFIQSCNVDFQKIEKKAAMMNHYEDVSLKLAKENRELHAEIKRLEFEIEKLKQNGPVAAVAHANNSEHATGHVSEHAVATHENSHEAKVEHATPASEHGTRAIASVAPAANHSKPNDVVEFKTYKWHAEDMMQIADKEFKEKHFEKAAQFYFSVLENYPHHKAINDDFYFKAGIASYESGVHHDWTISHFEALMKTYPTSQYFRSAKLWVALTHLKQGDKKKFFTTVEEFRKKYRNTNEWKILSSYYEKIEEKTNE